MDAQNNTTTNHCVFEPISFHRFLLIIAIGTPISIVGVLGNLLLIAIFFQPKYRSLPTLYLGVLAVLDLQLCIGYLMMCTCDAIALYYRNLDVYNFWHDSSMIVFTLARIGAFASTYMMVFATIERFLLVGEYTRFSCLYSPKGIRYILLKFMFPLNRYLYLLKCCKLILLQQKL